MPREPVNKKIWALAGVVFALWNACPSVAATSCQDQELLIGSRIECATLDEANGLYRFKSDEYGGKPFPYVSRETGPRALKLLDTSNVISGQISYGQSWRNESLALPSDVVASGRGDGRAMTSRVAGDDNTLPDISLDFFADKGGDFINLSLDQSSNHSPGNGAGNIGRIAAQVLVGMRDRFKAQQQAVLELGGGYPGQTWATLRPDGEIPAATDGSTPAIHPWASLVTQVATAQDVALRYGKRLRIDTVGFTHGAYSEGYKDGDGNDDYYAVLAGVLKAFDKADFNDDGVPIPVFYDQTAVTSEGLKAYLNFQRQADFAEAHAGRVVLYGPRYPYAFRDNIHHTGKAYGQIGELEGYAKFLVMDKKVQWKLFKITQISVKGSTLRVTVTAPPGFGDLQIDTRQIEAAPQLGFHIRRMADGAELPLSDFAVTGNTITARLALAPKPGEPYEVSYAYRGPGAAIGAHAGVWGNIKRQGPPSVIFSGETIDTYLLTYMKEMVF